MCEQYHGNSTQALLGEVITYLGTKMWKMKQKRYNSKHVYINYGKTYMMVFMFQVMFYVQRYITLMEHNIIFNIL